MQYKIVMLGDGGCGRTYFLTRVNMDYLDRRRHIADWGEFYAMDFNNNKYIIFDCGGPKRFSSLYTLYYDRANAFIIAVDLTSQESYAGANVWYKLILRCRTIPGHIPPIMLLLTKSDLTNKRVVTDEMIWQFCSEFNIKIILSSSALNGHNIDSFLPALEKIITTPYQNLTTSIIYGATSNDASGVNIYEYSVLIIGDKQAQIENFLEKIKQQSPEGLPRVIFPFPQKKEVVEFNFILADISVTAAPNFEKPPVAIIFMVSATNRVSLYGYAHYLKRAFALCPQHLHIPVIVSVNHCGQSARRVLSRQELISFSSNNNFDAIVEVDDSEPRSNDTLITTAWNMLHGSSPNKLHYYSLAGNMDEVGDRRKLRRNVRTPIIGIDRTSLPPSENAAIRAMQRQADPQQLATDTESAAQRSRDIQQQRARLAQRHARAVEARIEQQRRVEAAIREQQRLDALPTSAKCPVCLNSDTKTAFFPCGHTGVCPECAEELMTTTKKCPVCRKAIARWVQCFFTS